jgi:hypothetical protein
VVKRVKLYFKVFNKAESATCGALPVDKGKKLGCEWYNE